jgi:hypothetical protein
MRSRVVSVVAEAVVRVVVPSPGGEDRVDGVGDGAVVAVVAMPVTVEAGACDDAEDVVVGAAQPRASSAVAANMAMTKIKGSLLLNDAPVDTRRHVALHGHSSADLVERHVLVGATAFEERRDKPAWRRR